MCYGVAKRLELMVRGLGRFFGARHDLPGLLAVGDIANCRGDKHSIFGFERAQADLDRKLGAVLSQAVKIQVRTHGSGARIRIEARPTTWVVVAESLRHQEFHPLSNQFVARVAEQFLSLSIDQLDPTVAI